MSGLYNWATSSLYSVGSTAYNTTYNVTAAIGSKLYNASSTAAEILFPPAVTTWASDTFNQVWPGLMHSTDCVRVVPNVIHDKTRKVLGHSAYDNLVVQAGGVILSKVLLKQLVNAIGNQHPAAAAVTEYSLDFAINTYFTSKVIPNAINNWLYASNAYKAAYDENINDGNYKSDKPLTWAALQGMLAGPIYQGSKLVAVTLVYALADYKLGLSRYKIDLGGYQVHPGTWLDFSLKAFVYGQNLNEAKLTSQWISTEDLNKELSKNNWNSLAKGSVFLGSLNAMSWGIGKATGVNSSLVDGALFSFWYQYNIVASLLNKEPLPGKREGTDIFYYNRYLTEKLIEDSYNWIVGQFRSPVECDLILMPVLPVREKINFQTDFPGKSNTAFIIVGQQLYYLDKNQKYLVPVESVSKTKVKKLMHALKIPFINSSDKPRCFNEDKTLAQGETKPLSPEMMQFISFVTGYSHPDTSKNVLGTLGGMIGHQVDCDLIFSAFTPMDTEFDLLPGSSRTAFVVVDDRFYFVDKAQKKVSRVDGVGKEKIEKLKIALDVPLSDNFEKSLWFGNQPVSLEILDMITLVTGSNHPDSLDWKKLGKDIDSMKVVQLTKKMFVPSDFKSFDAFMKSKTMTMYTSLQFANINYVCEQLMRVRNEPLINGAMMMPESVVSAETKKYVRALLAKWLDGILEQISRYVYIKRANLGLDLLVHDVDGAKKHLREMLQKIEESHFELHGGGVIINGKAYPASLAKIKELIEDVLGPNADALTREIYNKTITTIRDELFGKSFSTYGVFKIGARDESTAQLYRDILLMCIDMELPAEKLTALPAQQVAVTQQSSTIESQKVVDEVPQVASLIPQTTYEEIRKENAIKVKQHLVDILEKVRMQNYNLGPGGGETVSGETKKYPQTIAYIIELLRGVTKSSAPLLTIKTHNDAIQLIRKALEDKITDPGGLFGFGGSHKTTIKFYQEVLMMCDLMPDEAKPIKSVRKIEVKVPSSIQLERKVEVKMQASMQPVQKVETKVQEFTQPVQKVETKVQESTQPVQQTEIKGQAVVQSVQKVDVKVEKPVELVGVVPDTNADTSSEGHMPPIFEDYDPLNSKAVMEEKIVKAKSSPSNLRKNSIFSDALILSPILPELKSETSNALKHQGGGSHSLSA